MHFIQQKTEYNVKTLLVNKWFIFTIGYFKKLFLICNLSTPKFESNLHKKLKENSLELSMNDIDNLI